MNLVLLIKRNITIILSLIVYRITLDYIYTDMIYPNFRYIGYKNEFSINTYVSSWIMLLIFSFLLIKMQKYKTNGALVISILITVSAIPTTMIVAFYNTDSLFNILNIIYWYFVVFLYTKQYKNIKIKQLRNYRSNMGVYFITGFLFILLLFIGFFYTGFHFKLNLYDVYEVRNNFKASNIPMLLEYLFASCIIIIPVILTYAICSGKKYLAFLALISQLLAFSIDGRKSTILILLLTVLGHFIIKKLEVNKIVCLVTFLTIAGLLEKLAFNTVILIDLIIRRCLIVTAHLQFAYYDYFSFHEKDFFRQGIIGRFGFDSPYTMNIPDIIGNEYYLHGSYANNGLFGDAYSNLGIIGVVILPILITLALKYLDKVSLGLNQGLCLGIVLVSAYAFLSSSFFTVMLTHGFLIGCIVLNMIPRFTLNE